MSPLVAAVGRLVPVKRLHLLVQALVELKPGHPGLQAVIAGEGYERPALEAQIRAAGAESWISLPGYLSEEDLIDLYRRAWVVASTSLREGWGMTLTEAGACGTPSVVSRISGHEDAVRDRITGILVDRPDRIRRCHRRRAPRRCPEEAARDGCPRSLLAIHLGRHRPRHPGRPWRRGTGKAVGDRNRAHTVAGAAGCAGGCGWGTASRPFSWVVGPPRAQGWMWSTWQEGAATSQ